MLKLFLRLLIVCVFLSSQAGCVLRSITASESKVEVPAQGYGTLARFPFKEAWYGMYFKEDKVGYSHFSIEPSGENFTISSDSIMRLTAMKKTNEVLMKERVDVRPDLTLIAFSSRVDMNGRQLDMKGAVKDGKFVVNIKVDGESLSREFPIEGKLYHSSAISLMPALVGLQDGKTHSFAVFNAEKQDVERVEQHIWTVAGSPGPKGAIWNVKNSFGKSVIRSWLDKKGLTVLEKALDGSLITLLEDRETAEQFLKKKAQGKDLVLDFSLIKVAKPIPNPERARFLQVQVRGIDPSLIAQDHRQRVTVSSPQQQDGRFDVSVQVEDPLTRRDGKNRAAVGEPIQASLEPDLSDPVSHEHLAATVAIPSDHEEIVEQARQIVSPQDSDFEKVEKLVRWTSENIRGTMKDSFTALSVLRSREGECQSHAGLYTALARSQKIPTRQVTGLVYTDNVGFLYHAWAESYVNGWIAVDPTLNQLPADATHIKIAAADESHETASLLRMIGNVKLEVVEVR